MSTETYTQSYTVETVIETTKTAFNEYRSACKRCSDVDTLRDLNVLNPLLDRILDRLESAADDEEILDRLASITIGEPEKRCLFLTGLNEDIKSLSTHLQQTGQDDSPLQVPDMNIYVQSLDRYGEVLKTVQKKKMKSVSFH
jgi:hypothetical protein